VQSDAPTPVDELLASLRQTHPALRVDRLRVKHPADDDNLWFVGDGREVQFDCQPDGSPPFLIEGGDDERVQAQSVGEALAEIRRLLKL
jgi:hypothetical protein